MAPIAIPTTANQAAQTELASYSLIPRLIASLGTRLYSMSHAWEACENLWVVHVILARVGYNWHVAVDLGYIAS